MTDLSTAWRPFEASREAAQAAERELEANTCNRHRDCEAADRRARTKNGVYDGFARGADHCHDECCEECFGC